MSFTVAFSFAVFAFLLGFYLGIQYMKSRPVEIAEYTTDQPQGYIEIQRAAIQYESDAERIRELNTLDTNATKFMRLLQHHFTENELIVKNGRFYVLDADTFPIAIFEYEDGRSKLHIENWNQGIPIFVYKGLLSSEAIKKDKLKILKAI